MKMYVVTHFNGGRPVGDIILRKESELKYLNGCTVQEVEFVGKPQVVSQKVETFLVEKK